MSPSSTTTPLPEGERREGPVALVAGDVGHVGAPEVVAEELPQRTQAQDVAVAGHGGDVVVHEVAPERVDVAAERQGGDAAVGRRPPAAAAVTPTRPPPAARC